MIDHQPKLDLVHRISLQPNPPLLEHARQRAESAQNRAADRITMFAGSMAFVYIHIIWFGSWIVLGIEKYPYGPDPRTDKSGSRLRGRRPPARRLRLGDLAAHGVTASTSSAVRIGTPAAA